MYYGAYQPQQQPYNPYLAQQIPQQSPMVSRREYEDLMNKISQLGERFNVEPSQGAFNQAGYGNPNSQGGQANYQAAPPQIALMAVDSESKAWNHPNDLSGNKQFFIDMSTMTVYAKWVDENIDLQRAVGKLQMITGDSTGAEVAQAQTVDVAEIVKGVDEKLSDLGEEMTEIKALIEAANVFQTTKAKPKGKAAKQIELVEEDE